MKFKVGDKVRGIGGDIRGCEGFIDHINDKGQYALKLTKLGDYSFHMKPFGFVIGELLRHNDSNEIRYSDWSGCLKLIRKWDQATLK